MVLVSREERAGDEEFSKINKRATEAARFLKFGRAALLRRLFNLG